MERNKREWPVGEAGMRLHRSRERVIRLVQMGKLRGVKRDGHWMVDADSLAEFEQREAADDSSRAA